MVLMDGRSRQWVVVRSPELVGALIFVGGIEVELTLQNTKGENLDLHPILAK